MGVENFDKIAAADVGKRSVKRARVLLSARLQTSFGGVEARLRDLSQKGALLECKEPLEVGSQIVFSRGDTVVPARVAWCGDGRVGLEFLRDIDEREVLVQLASPSKAPEQRYRRPRLFGEGMSPLDVQRARQWGLQVGLAIPD